jgi:hypothetical protein
MLLRPATPDDIPAILALERTPFASTFVGQWSDDRHRSTLTGGDARYYVSESEDGDVQPREVLAYASCAEFLRTPAPSSSSALWSAFPSAAWAARF